MQICSFCVTIRRVLNLDINRLKPASNLYNNKFSIQQLYVLPTLYLCVLYLSENNQPLVPLTT